MKACRCGAKPVKGRCPNQTASDFIKHDLVAQAYNTKNRPNWTVLPEEAGFRAYAGEEPLNALFDTEEEAWDKLAKIYWGHEDEEEEEDAADLG